MKKTIALVLTLALSLTLAACGGEQPPAETMVESSAAVLWEVEITMENWQDYLDLREAQRVSVGESGGVTNREFGYGIFLKEEYVDQLAEVDVSFQMQVDSVLYQVYGDLTTDNFVIRKDTLHNEGIQILTAAVEDLRENGKIGPDTDLYNAVAAYFTLSGEFGC